MNTSRQQIPLALPQLLALLLPLLLTGCMAPQARPLLPINSRLERNGSGREPAIAGRWLALISGRGGREQVQLLDLQQGLLQPLTGLNRADAQPMSVSVDARGERLALVRQLGNRTELVLYRRSQGLLQPLPVEPAGVPRRVQLRADGRQLAVEVSRNGLWQVDLLSLP
jgi:hypothetical protein